MLETQLLDIKRGKLSKLVASSEDYPERKKIVITKPQAPDYKSVLAAKQRTKIFKTGSYKYTPSENYKIMLQNANSCIFNIKKRIILSNTIVLDGILNLIYQNQKD